MNDFKAISDEQLIESGERFEIIATELIVRYKKMVEAKASKYACEFVERDDLIQEGMLGLLSAISHYNKDKKTAFSTFASRCVENRMINAVKKVSPYAYMTKSIETETDDANIDTQMSPEEILVLKEQAKAMSEKIKNHLSSLETEILNMFLNGYTYEQIAKRKSITLKAVDNALQRARRKLKSIFR